MRAWIFSDLHLDVNEREPFALPDPRPAHDVVIIAGDICEGIANGVRWIVARGLNAKPVIYVPGNHEHYSHDFMAGLVEGRAVAADYRNIHMLDRAAVTIDGVKFAGATLWTDYRLYGEAWATTCMLRAERVMNDHRFISNGESLWAPAHAIAEHELSRQWLGASLDERSAGPTVVVTHHAPSIKSIDDRYRDDFLTAAFASDCEQLAMRANFWVHGHTHIGCDYRIGDCRVMNNPRGYALHGEGQGFDKTLIVDV
jgi:predicted phosphodiesterase